MLKTESFMSPGGMGILEKQLLGKNARSTMIVVPGGLGTAVVFPKLSVSGSMDIGGPSTALRLER